LVIGVGLAIAALSALASNIGFLLRDRGANAAPDVDIRKPGRTVVALFSEKWWTLGFLMAIVAWGLHLASLKLSPLSLVQAVLASGLVMMAIIAERFFGFSVGKREWIGIGLVTLGLALLGVTASSAESNGGHAEYAIGGAIAFEGALGVGALAAYLYSRTDRGQAYVGVLLGAAAGLMFTASHVGLKAMSGFVDFADPITFLTPWVPAIVAAFVVAFFSSARSLQVGDAVPVIAITSAISTATAIAAGVVVFGDPLGEGFVAPVRIAAFLLVVIAAALIPAPVRVSGEREEGDEEKATGEKARSEKRQPAPATASA
jgi:drug/metabolite transporter (DMT)-like permease